MFIIQMTQRTQQYLSSKSIGASKLPEDLRKDFLNNSLKSNSSEEMSSNQDQQSDDEYVHNMGQSNSSSQQHRFSIEKQALITKKPNDWHNVQISLQQDESRNNVFEKKQQNYNYSETPQIFNIIKKQQSSPQLTTTHSSIQVSNYKKMLKNQLQKSKKLEEALYKQSKKSNYMAQLIQKLQQQNKLLRKIVHQQRQKRKNKQKSNKKQSKHYEYDQSTSSALNAKAHHINRLCYGSKLK